MKAQPYPKHHGSQIHVPLLMNTGNYALTPGGVQRNVQLASVLEPLVYTPNKTTRESDCSLDQRFAFFLTAGVNIGESFRLLAERLLDARRRALKIQPLIFDYGHIAQAESKRQRAGGRTNQVIISMLIPLVAAQILYLDEEPNPDNIDKTFDAIHIALRNTSHEDVHYARELERLGYNLSDWQEYAKELDLYGGNNVWEFYANKGMGVNGKDAIDVPRPAYYEFIHDYPTTRLLVYEILNLQQKEDPSLGFQHIISEACANVQATLPPTYAHALMADNTAVALYILLSHFQHHEVIF